MASNRSLIELATFFSTALFALYLGSALAPTYLQDARGVSVGSIGVLSSLSTVGCCHSAA